MDEIIKATAEFVKKELANAEKGHDWGHIQRVLNNARTIQKYEGGDLLTIELGALLHDIADTKFYSDEELGPKKAKEFLSQFELPRGTIGDIQNIIRYISFSKSFEEKVFDSLELKVLQDADRLDAIGAIGIARAFTYGGYKGREIYNPDIKPCTKLNQENYRSSNGTTINHFYEKLLKLRDMMNTKTGRQMAEQRHNYMVDFLNQFYDEVNGNK